MIIIGIDPDSDKSGFAQFENGKITELCNMTLFDFRCHAYGLTLDNKPKDIQIHIENITGTSHNFTAKKATSLPAKLKIARNIGRCEQVQIEIEHIAKEFDIPVFRHSLSGKWKKGKSEIAQFKQLTGWEGKSNEDTRSAAYFGYIGVLKSGQTT